LTPLFRLNDKSLHFSDEKSATRAIYVGGNVHGCDEMNEKERDHLFSDLITRHQSQLYGYIFAVVRNWEDADDLFQSVCLVLWSKFESFRMDSDFFAWARQIAKNKVADLMRHKRSMIHVGEELLTDLTTTAKEMRTGGGDTYLTALESCREKLNRADQELLAIHYTENLGSRQIADRLQRSQTSVCNSLNRIRGWLFECIQMELARQEHAGRRGS
jgi:RNA polymerase sigma-70 factor, ECF subfamily